MATIETVKSRETKRLMAIAGVVGVGITKHAGAPAIVILVDRLSDELKAKLPESIEGHPVVIEAVGRIRPL